MRILCFILFLSWSFIGVGQTQNDSLAIETLLDTAKSRQGKLKYAEAYEIFLKALNLAKNKKYKAMEFKTEIAIANMYVMKGEEDLAKYFFENKFPDLFFPKQIQSNYYHRKAFYFNQRWKLDSALAAAKNCVKIAKEDSLTADLITIYNEMGFIYERQKKYSLSKEYYDKVLELTGDDLETYSNASLNKARLYTLIKRHKESNRMLENNLRKIEATDWLQTKLYIHDILAQNYKALGDSTNFYKHLYNNKNELLKIKNEYSESQYKDLLLKYQTAQKDKLISENEKEQKKLIYGIIGLLSLVILSITFAVLIRNRNQKLNKLLTKNSFLLSELNHRIKNNLQLIVSLTAREIIKTDNSEITGLVNLASKIESIAALHKQLYLNDELKSIRLKPYIDEIIGTIAPFLHQNEIEVLVEVNDIEINSGDSLYIGLIVNELLVNSIKHAFAGKNNKQIKIVLSADKKGLGIIYEDNGTGIANGTKVKLLSTLSRQIEADYDIEYKEGFQYTARIKT